MTQKPGGIPDRGLFRGDPSGNPDVPHPEHACPLMAVSPEQGAGPKLPSAISPIHLSLTAWFGPPTCQGCGKAPRGGWAWAPPELPLRQRVLRAPRLHPAWPSSCSPPRIPVEPPPARLRPALAPAVTHASRVHAAMSAWTPHLPTRPRFSLALKSLGWGCATCFCVLIRAFHVKAHFNPLSVSHPCGDAPFSGERLQLGNDLMSMGP